MKAFFLILYFSLLAQACIYGQTIPGPTDPNAFSELNETRNKLNSEIPDLKERINSIYIQDLASIRFQIKNLLNNNDSYEKELQRRKNINPNDTSINSYEYSINANLNIIKQLQMDSLKAEILSHEKDTLQHELNLKKLKLNDVESRINQLMIPKISQQNFMFWSSIAFVLLMGFLLGTFFYVVSRDATIRQKIFGTDSGIQFITLFSIVIAIILFGLTGVLEGKELSALLGSVAGYILGKVTISSTPSSPSSGTQTPPPPPPTPAIKSILPNQGPVAGGTLITIAGEGFTNGATVTIGANAAFATVVDSNHIVASTPSHAAGSVDIIVTNNDGKNISLANGFKYV